MSVPRLDYEGNTTSYYYVGSSGISSNEDQNYLDMNNATEDSDDGFNIDILWIAGVSLLGFVGLLCCFISIIMFFHIRKKRKIVVPMPIAPDVENHRPGPTQDLMISSHHSEGTLTESRQHRISSAR